MLPEHKRIVRATVPVLMQHGETITSTFYRELFTAHPELFNIFNRANQRNGGQARSLAASILSYAAHVENPTQLTGMLERITHKHASLEVQPEHYPIVGKHLLKAIQIVLGDAATPQIVDAWAAAYQQLAEVMIGREKRLYEDGENHPGGWRGYKPFTVKRKVRESDTIASFYLAPEDGQPLPPFLPGQFLGVKLALPDADYEQIRQYSLSHPPNGEFYRISVKRESSPANTPGAPNGYVSNYLHDYVKPGDSLLVHVPLGDFVLNESSNRPVVLLSGGVGITPAICMLQHLAAHQSQRSVLFVHATTSRAHHAFGAEVRKIAAEQPNVRAVIYYEHVTPTDTLGVEYDEIGRLSKDSLSPYLPAQAADYYYCGPVGFMAAVNEILDQLGVPLEQRYSETFAPDPSFETQIVKRAGFASSHV